MDNTRRLVIHHDDLGGSHSANLAFVELMDLGVVTCGSVMVPGPWFTEVADLARKRPDLDIGVHLTLTSEFPWFRWRPLTGGTSLVDDTGYFWPDIAGARTADPEEVHIELRAQILSALDAGIDVTHLDSHMGTVWQPEFLDIYVSLGEEFDLPIVLAEDVDQMSAPYDDLTSIFGRLRARKNPIFKRFLTTPFGNMSPDLADYKQILSRAEEGLNWCGFHFAAPGDIDVVTTDADTRIAEYEVFTSCEMRAYLESEDIELVGMREYRRRMRS